VGYFFSQCTIPFDVQLSTLADELIWGEVFMGYTLALHTHKVTMLGVALSLSGTCALQSAFLVLIRNVWNRCQLRHRVSFTAVFRVQSCRRVVDAVICSVRVSFCGG